MNTDLEKSFKDILSGLVFAQFNVEVRSERFKDILFSCIVQFFALLIVAILLGDTLIVRVLLLGLVFVIGTYIYHKKTDIKRVDLKAAFFFTVYSGLILPFIYGYCGKGSIGSALLLINLFFGVYFILKFIPGLILTLFSTGMWFSVYYFHDYFKTHNNMPEAQNPETDVAFSVIGFFIIVLTIGSLIRKTIYAYDEEQKEAQRLFEDYNSKLYKSGARNSFNDRFLLSNIATLGVVTEKGDIPGFTAVVFSIDNISILDSLSEEAKETTYEVFSRKVYSVISQNEIFVIQDDNTFALVLESVNPYEVEDKLDELIAMVHMTIFQYIPKDRLSLSVGYAIHTAGKSTANTMQKASDNMLAARRKGGNCKVGGAE